MWFIYSLLLIIFIQIGGILPQVPITTFDSALRKHLMNGYNYQGKPTDQTLNVGLSLSVYRIKMIDQIQNKVILGTYLRSQWNDPRLQWNPVDYNGIQQITISIISDDNMIYRPRLYLIKSEGSTDFPDLDKTMMQVKYNGDVYQSNSGSMVLNHQFNIKLYPIDFQVIKLSIMSINEDVTKLQLMHWPNLKYPLAEFEKPNKELEDTSYLESIEWERINITGQINEVKDIEGNKFSILQVEVLVKRSAFTPIAIVIFPSLLITMQSFNTYFIRINDPLRIQFGVSTFLTSILYLVMILQFQPLCDEGTIFETFLYTVTMVHFFIQVFILVQMHYYQFYQAQVTDYKNKVDQLKLFKYKRVYKLQKKQIKEIIKELEDEEAEIDGNNQTINLSEIEQPNIQQNLLKVQFISNIQQNLLKVQFRKIKYQSSFIVIYFKKLMQIEHIDYMFFIIFTLMFVWNQIYIYIQIEQLKNAQKML